MSPTLTVDDLRFDVVLSPRRQTIELTVERDGRLVIRAPERAIPQRLEAFVHKKRMWLYEKLAEKEALRHRLEPKEYVAGEGFGYLGRSYRLALVAAQEAPLRLEAGRFKLRRSEAPRGRAHFVRWYTERGRAWLRRRVKALAPRLGVGPAGVDVRDLGYRWGSCAKDGRLYFHWRTLLLPPRIAEYVVVHELVHLRCRHHTPEFWRRVERAVPDFAARKQWLAANAQEAAGI